MERENGEFKANLDQQKNIFEADKGSLEKTLESITNLLQEKEQTLQQKLAEQELLHRAREAQLLSEVKACEMSLTAMTTKRQANEDSYKTQIKELEEHFSDLEISSKNENDILKESLKAYKGSQIQQDEIKSLKCQLESMAEKIQELESTLKNERAQNEATAQNKEQLDGYRGHFQEERERQLILKDEVTFHQNKAYMNKVAYHHSKRALDRERNKTADLHRKLEELNKTLAEYSGKSESPQSAQAGPCEKDVSPHHGHPSNSVRSAAGQDRNRRQRGEGRPGLRGRKEPCSSQSKGIT
ncbi:hypothetical protein ANANG_G00211110 [Anguilla anguilla]|uniref:Uncharacterized protein n=1 Tax=Anguilla anguilla TaxID=7936 RepID=A0A9D3M3F1_ANGAN|nr:hypothetical protein ANANG_G00211110 [Anguilla anguilla]